MHIPNYLIFFLFSVNEYINRPGKHAVWCTNKIIQSCKYRKIREVDPIDLHHRFQCGSCKDHADYAKYFNTNCKYKKCHDSQHWHNYVINCLPPSVSPFRSIYGSQTQFMPFFMYIIDEFLVSRDYRNRYL